MLPILFHVGPFPVRAWGLLLMLGFLLATWRAGKNAARYKIAKEDVWDIALVGLLGGVIGARLAFVGLNTGYFLAHPGEIPALWAGGMTFYGGLGGGILAGVLACRAKNINIGDMSDLAAVSFPLGYCLGRIGCLLNGCCYGGLCDLPWATRFHLQDGSLTAPSHPAQLYSALAAVAMYALLLPLEKTRRFRGQVMLAFVFLYGVYRFVIEFVREGVTADVTSVAHLTQGQVASLLLAVFAALAYAVLLQKATRQGKTPQTA